MGKLPSLISLFLLLYLSGVWISLNIKKIQKLLNSSLHFFNQTIRISLRNSIKDCWLFRFETSNPRNCLKITKIASRSLKSGEIFDFLVIFGHFVVNQKVQKIATNLYHTKLSSPVDFYILTPSFWVWLWNMSSFGWKIKIKKRPAFVFLISWCLE